MTWDLQTLALILTGAVVPLLIYLLSRGPQLRQLKASDDVALVTSATQLVERLQDQIKLLEDKINSLESDRTTERINYTQQLNLAHNENVRISAIVAELRTNQDIDRRQIDELKAGHFRLEMKISDAALTPISPDQMNQAIAKLNPP